MPSRGADHVIELTECEIGRDLDQHRRRPRFAIHARTRLHHAREQLVEHPALLQVAQAGRIGRGNVAGEIARDRREHLDLLHIVRDAILGVLVGADIDADDAARAHACGEPPQHHIGALAVEAEAVDHALIGRQPEQARPRIARLRQRRDSPDFDGAEAEPKQRIRHLGVLVEPSRHADRIGKVEPEGAHRQERIILVPAWQRGKLERLDRQMMGGLGLEQPQQWPPQRVIKADHGTSSGKTCRPSAASGSGLTHSTQASGSSP